MKKLYFTFILFLFTLNINAGEVSHVEVSHVRGPSFSRCLFVDPQETYAVVNFYWQYDSEDFSAKEYMVSLTENGRDVEIMNLSVPSLIVRVDQDTINMRNTQRGSLTGTFRLKAGEVCSVLGDDVDVENFKSKYDLVIERIL